MSGAKRVDLDVSRLLGFRLQNGSSRGGKVGDKPTDRQTSAEVLLGAKVGSKDGFKLRA